MVHIEKVFEEVTFIDLKKKEIRIELTDIPREYRGFKVRVHRTYKPLTIQVKSE